MSATERPREGLAACPRGEVPVSRRSVGIELVESIGDSPEVGACSVSQGGGTPNPRRIVRTGKYSSSQVFLKTGSGPVDMNIHPTGVVPACPSLCCPWPAGKRQRSLSCRHRGQVLSCLVEDLPAHRIYIDNEH